MQTPDEIAARVVAAFTGDEYWIDTAAAIEDVAVALREYGDERARQERERCEAIATQRASEWRARLPRRPDSAVARWCEACDIAAAIRASPGGQG